MRAEDTLGRTEGHGAGEAQTIAPEDERTNDPIKAPATQEMKNAHIVSFYTRCKLRRYGVTTESNHASTSPAASLPASFCLIGSKKGLPTRTCRIPKKKQTPTRRL